MHAQNVITSWITYIDCMLSAWAASPKQEGGLPGHDMRFRNQLLNQLDAREVALLGDILLVDLVKDDVIEQADAPIHFVYFIEHGIASVSGRVDAGDIDVGMVGDEGMTGLSLLAGDTQSPLRTIVQIDGSAYRVEATGLLHALESGKRLSTILRRYARGFEIQVAATSIANGTAKLEERLARWLLMVGDRIGTTFQTTHVSLAVVLGVQRSGVTLALQALEGRGLIRSRRGSVAIVDWSGLIEASKGAYGLAEREQSRLSGASLE